MLWKLICKGLWSDISRVSCLSLSPNLLPLWKRSCTSMTVPGDNHNSNDAGRYFTLSCTRNYSPLFTKMFVLNKTHSFIYLFSNVFLFSFGMKLGKSFVISQWSRLFHRDEQRLWTPSQFCILSINPKKNLIKQDRVSEIVMKKAHLWISKKSELHETIL